ncbi:GTA-gp10 family protein [Methylobacterium dankookense]|uniref:Uncharacterized protein n=1 Tax=Methylobacterium dankookense TaxID=560405 RepID=A0A564G6B8_9HYPH|nr:GTA-gp10 family protein [Methylobacterium dankookense]GJD58150.1 hypothetical protein IFDJLNFL_4065 [Methylobacterium dankookense]VUF15101.1 hypothetical protein MTDSW087_04834 [Methylobacterium dankookense]
MSDRDCSEITAVFGGRSVTFRLEPGAHWSEIITAWLGPPLALQHRAIAGQWSPAEIAAVLKLAYVGAPLRAAMQVPEVDDVLERRPAGTYAVLVLRILEAYLFGIDPRDATFDERDAYGAAA